MPIFRSVAADTRRASTPVAALTAVLAPVLAAALGWAGPAGAESVEQFPSKPITIIAHTGPASSTDIFARELARAAEPILGQTIVVENRAGGGGATQMAALKRAQPDGYTVGVFTISHLTAWRTNLKGVYSWRDFDWVSLNQHDPYVLIVGADSPIKSIADLAARSKQSKVKIGGYGNVGSAHNIALNILAEAAGIDFDWVTYPGGSEGLSAVVGGHIDAYNSNPGPVLQLAEAGRVRVLGISAEERLPALPDTPTYREAGYDVDSEWEQLRGLYAPKGVPEPVLNKLGNAFIQAMKDPAFQAYLERSGQHAGTLVGADFAAFVEKQDARAGEWLERVGMAGQGR